MAEASGISVGAEIHDGFCTCLLYTSVQDYLILAHPQADLPQIKHAEEITHGDKEEISTGKSAPAVSYTHLDVYKRQDLL